MLESKLQALSYLIVKAAMRKITSTTKTTVWRTANWPKTGPRSEWMEYLTRDEIISNGHASRVWCRNTTWPYPTSSAPPNELLLSLKRSSSPTFRPEGGKSDDSGILNFSGQFQLSGWTRHQLNRSLSDGTSVHRGRLPICSRPSGESWHRWCHRMIPPPRINYVIVYLGSLRSGQVQDR
jgi:hypothetical protein